FADSELSAPPVEESLWKLALPTKSRLNSTDCVANRRKSWMRGDWGTASGSGVAGKLYGGAQMNHLKVRLGLVAFLVCGCMLLVSTAQDMNDTSKLTRYVTGCIQQGHNADQYQLIAENAKWHLRSDNFTLEEYVGQEVKVAGVVSNQP